MFRYPHRILSNTSFVQDEAPLSALKKLAIARQKKDNPQPPSRQRILFKGRGRARVPVPFDEVQNVHKFEHVVNKATPDLESSAPSVSAQTPMQPAKPMSKLAAMAAARRQQQQPPPTPTVANTNETPPQPSNVSNAPAKPLSKLQSKVLQARSAPSQEHIKPPPPRELTASEKLFVQLDTNIEKTSPSNLGNVVIKATSKPLYNDKDIADSLWTYYKGAFDGPSPDDVVLQARKGTALDVADRG